MLKIYIIGGSGSGKSTLAESLSASLHIPHYDLDKSCWKNGQQWAGYIADACAIAEQPGWIAEGNFLVWTDPLFFQADYIVRLEISWPLAAWRILSRHIWKSLRGINPYPGLNGLRLLFILLKDARKYYLHTAYADPVVEQAVRLYLAEHEGDTTLANAETLLLRWERCMKEIPLTADFVRLYLEKYREKVFFVKNKADRAALVERLLAAPAG